MLQTVVDSENLSLSLWVIESRVLAECPLCAPWAGQQDLLLLFWECADRMSHTALMYLSVTVPDSLYPTARGEKERNVNVLMM